MAPFLYINVTLLEERYTDGQAMNAYSVSVEVKFEQVVLLERDPAVRMAAPTWSVTAMVTGPSRDLRVFCRDTVRDQVDKFLNAFLEQNPR